ncbi:MAG: transketolase, partial [Brevundimonas sp.]|uniref:transketolase-like TK C-terminal-containing protein n=1 Tax=Brevundimonas sp. TaxID=1871086 RepID=UPI001A246AE7
NQPSAMALSRQKTPAVRTFAASENLSARGAYELRAANGEARVTLFATGTEVPLALAAADRLEANNTPTRVVSVPCFELFEQQDAAYQASVIGRGTVRVAVEAAIKQGWERFIGEDGAFVGMTGFGASAPAEVLYEKFGITTEAVVAAAKARL